MEQGWAAIRKLAKANGINTFQKSREAILKELHEKGIEHDIPSDLPITKDLTGTVKKGYASWQPAQRLNVVNRKPGFRYRWVDRDPANLEKKLAEGWVLVNGTSGKPEVEHERRPHPSDGTDLTSAKRYRELVLMALPEELGKARDAFMAEQTQKQTLGLKADLERENRDAARSAGFNPAKLHGTIVIS